MTRTTITPPKTKVTICLPAEAAQMILRDPEAFKQYMAHRGFPVEIVDGVIASQSWYPQRRDR